jgi:hypothetical protein
MSEGSPATGYRITRFAEQDGVGARDVVALWTGEGGLAVDEAERRVAEVLLVGTDAAGNLAAVCTTYLQHSDQLRTEMWYLRVFVAAAHRRTGLALELALTARDHLSRRFTKGEDRRAPGILFQIESPILKRFFPDAVWPRTQFTFIGENDRGHHIRVYYFPGALAPGPD